MDFVKTQLDRIQKQLAGLTASQKMLAGCLVAIIVLTVMWWGRYAGTPEMTPLFETAMTPEENAKTKRVLEARGYVVEITADNLVAVPAAKATSALADLAAVNALPKNRKIDFDTLLKGVTPFTSESMSNAHLLNYKNSKLAEIISGMRGVRDASVVIDTTKDFRLGGGGVKPSAAVYIQMEDGATPTQDLVQGVAGLVLGGAAVVERDRIQVIIDNQLWPVRDNSDVSLGGNQILELTRQNEEWLRGRLVGHLHIPGASVYLTLKPNTQTRQTQSRKYDKDGIVQAEAMTKERSLESTVPGAAGGGEPGAVPNGPMSLSAVPAPAGDAVTSETESEAKFDNRFGEEVSTVNAPAGDVQVVKASVRIPRSYIVRVLTGDKPNAPEPDDASVQKQFGLVKTEMLAEVKTCVALASDADVSMGMYYDFAPPGMAVARAGGAALGIPGAPGAAATAGSTMAAIFSAHSREIVLGGLAIVSLFMVSMMVRRAGPVVAGAGGVAAAGVFQTPMPVLDASEALVGEVSEGKSMLDAMELDEDAVRAQQMLDQVSSMVEDNPDAAAGLVKRWLSRT
jgi:flagellar biosynthesis/type III secretory pathway M-ring protein FliF/YscJ